jgi:hypothetical protein
METQLYIVGAIITFVVSWILLTYFSSRFRNFDFWLAEKVFGKELDT